MVNWGSKSVGGTGYFPYGRCGSTWPERLLSLSSGGGRYIIGFFSFPSGEAGVEGFAPPKMDWDRSSADDINDEQLQSWTRTHGQWPVGTRILGVRVVALASRIPQNVPFVVYGQMASTSYDNIDFDADDFTLPPQIDTDFTAPSRLVSTTTNNRPTSPIQIDQEVIVKNKRKPAVKLIDR